MLGMWFCKEGQGIMRKTRVDTSAMWALLPPEVEIKRCFCVPLRIIPSIKHSFEYEHLDKFLNHNTRLFHDFT